MGTVRLQSSPSVILLLRGLEAVWQPSGSRQAPVLHPNVAPPWQRSAPPPPNYLNLGLWASPACIIYEPKGQPCSQPIKTKSLPPRAGGRLWKHIVNTFPGNGEPCHQTRLWSVKKYFDRANRLAPSYANTPARPGSQGDPQEGI